MKLIIIGILVAVLILLAIRGCRRPSVSFEARMNGKTPEFHMPLHNANGLLGVTIWDGLSGKMLWNVNLNYYPGPVLRYGEVPKNFTTFNGARNSADQVFPSSGSPAALPAGRDFFVTIYYQYDQFISACGGDSSFAFRMDSNRNIINLGEQPLPEQLQSPHDSDRRAGGADAPAE